jgi:hypothetical protein
MYNKINIMSATQNNLNDHNYLDITIQGAPAIDPDDNIIVRAEYKENRTEAILAVPNEWEMGVVRFSVPSDNIPLFNFLNNTYKVRLYDPAFPANVYIAFVTYTTIHGPSPYGPTFQPIFTYSEFIDRINVALSSAYAILKGVNAAFPGTLGNPPLLQYDPVSKIVSLYAEIAGWDNNVATHPLAGRILFNESLLAYFPGLQTNIFPISFPGYTNIVVRSRVGNTVTYNTLQYYIMQSDFIDVLNWDEVAQVVITTTSVPIIPEQKAVGNNQNAVFQALLTDFNFAGVGFREAGRLTFYNQANIRYYDMISDHPMTQFDLQFQFADLAGNIFPIFISQGDSANIKILFKRKSTVES